MDASIQDRLFSELTCFGCGPANARGLRLKSFLRDGVVVATFTPWPEHDNGFGFLNGGIIATVLDCHSAAAVATEAATRGWAPPPGVPMGYVTSGIAVRFLRPAPLGRSVQLRAVVSEAGEDEMTCAVEMLFDGKQRAAGEAVWKRWRPR